MRQLAPKGTKLETKSSKALKHFVKEKHFSEKLQIRTLKAIKGEFLLSNRSIVPRRLTGYFYVFVSQ
jgi:hypothetical protein